MQGKKKALRLGRGSRTSRESKPWSTRYNDFSQIDINHVQVPNNLCECSPLLLTLLHRAHRHRHLPTKGPILHVDILQAKVITVGANLPTLEHFQGSLRIVNRLKVHNGIGGVVPNDTSDDPAIEAANVLRANEVE
jgi:hypothetical protein